MTESVTKLGAKNPGKPAKSKREKFVELAERRTKNAIKAIRIIGKLGNSNAYEYDESDVRKIVKALNNEVEAMRNRMSSTKASDEVEFKL